MPLRPSLFTPALVLALILGGCQTTGQGALPEESKPLPANIRSIIARQLTVAYVSDGIGPATITEIKPAAGLFGGALHSATVRYPVKDRNWFAGEGASTTRCVDVTIRPGNSGFSIETSRSRREGENCYGDAPASPFVELSQIGERSQACKARGEATCLLSATNISEAEARKLMKAH